MDDSHGHAFEGRFIALLGLLELTTAQLSEPLSISVSNKGRAVFLIIHVPDGNGGWQHVGIPRESLHKLDYDQAIDTISLVNQTAQATTFAAVSEPTSETFIEDDEFSETPDELDELLDEIKAGDLPKLRRRTSGAEPAEATV